MKKYLNKSLLCMIPLWLLSNVIYLNGYELMLHGITIGNIGFVLLCGIVLIAGALLVLENYTDNG